MTAPKIAGSSADGEGPVIGRMERRHPEYIRRPDVVEDSPAVNPELMRSEKYVTRGGMNVGGLRKRWRIQRRGYSPHPQRAASQGSTGMMSAKGRRLATNKATVSGRCGERSLPRPDNTMGGATNALARRSEDVGSPSLSEASFIGRGRITVQDLPCSSSHNILVVVTSQQPEQVKSPQDDRQGEFSTLQLLSYQLYYLLH